jgi:nitrate reductase gamma subunit
VSGKEFGVRIIYGGSCGLNIVAALSMWFERRVVNRDARVSRSFVVAVGASVLSLSACREAVWLIKSGVLVRHS